MRLNLFLLTLFVILGSSVLFAQNAQNVLQDKSAKIVFKETMHDFGEVAQDTILVHAFVFFNKGSDSLRIFHLKSG